MSRPSPTGVGLVEALAFSPDGSVLAIAFTRSPLQTDARTTAIQFWRPPLKK
jgi:hypothetical protein